MKRAVHKAAKAAQERDALRRDATRRDAAASWKTYFTLNYESAVPANRGIPTGHCMR